MARNTITTEDFVRRAISVHGAVYDYGRTLYSGTKNKVEVICPTHGSFWVTPNNHITNKSGCPACARSKSGDTQRVAASVSFVEECKAVHSDKYTYEKTQYQNAHTKVIVTCPIHGDFLIAPYSHRQGQGCKKCGIISRNAKNTLTTSTFIDKSNDIHKNRYVYDYVVYTTSKTKVQIICPDHGPFMQRPTQHMRGEGCPECGRQNWFAEQGGYCARYFDENPEERNRTGVLYLIRFSSPTEEFYKIGITTQSVKHRFHWGYTAYNLDVIAEHHMSIYDAWVKEQHIINAFKDQRYVPTIKIGGYTECFTNRVDVKYIQSLM